MKITESREGVTVQADVRGFAPKELEVDLEPRRVTIIGERYNTASPTDNASEARITELFRTTQWPVEIGLWRLTHFPQTARLKRGILELDMKKTVAWKAGQSTGSSTAHPN